MPTGDGVHVFGAGADVALRGRAVYQWLDRIAPRRGQGPDDRHPPNRWSSG
ncbi:hypothetical protein AB0D10_37250 [Kitasatospora sp. NPDC048545]|uniref:hypothetical protein n=1 Tax=Kitasatospora sp. NPDC048545 TaxID=3157208 RepID=UPI0033F21E0E